MNLKDLLSFFYRGLRQQLGPCSQELQVLKPSDLDKVDLSCLPSMGQSQESRPVKLSKKPADQETEKTKSQCVYSVSRSSLSKDSKTQRSRSCPCKDRLKKVKKIVKQKKVSNPKSK